MRGAKTILRGLAYLWCLGGAVYVVGAVIFTISDEGLEAAWMSWSGSYVILILIFLPAAIFFAGGSAIPDMSDDSYHYDGGDDFGSSGDGGGD
jgi:hypothetical protein